jgi:NADH-quinone oxidoreductase subunit E
MKSKTDLQLAAEVTNEIDAWLKKFPLEQKRSAVVAGLLKAQEQNGGWLSDEVMQAVADYLQLPHIEVYEVATFYDMFELQPIGKIKIGLCTNVSCMLRGSKKIEAALEQKLGVKLGQTTVDQQFTLRETECLGACANGPVCQVDNKDYIEDLTPEKMIALIEQMTQENNND